MIQELEAPNNSEIQKARARGHWCEGCGAIDETVERLAGYSLNYCPRCAVMHHMGDKAVDHLADAIAKFVPGWKEYWLSKGADEQYLGEILEPVERALLNDYMRPIITEAYKGN